jgi:hypothetical protein
MVSDSAHRSRAQSPAEAELDVSLRIHDELLEALDRWIASRPEPRPSRQDAISYILTERLAARSGSEASLSS